MAIGNLDAKSIQKSEHGKAPLPHQVKFRTTRSRIFQELFAGMVILDGNDERSRFSIISRFSGSELDLCLMLHFYPHHFCNLLNQLFVMFDLLLRR